MIRRYALPWLLVGGLLAFVSPAGAKPAVTDIRIGEHTAMTRFVLDLTADVKPRVFMLADPYRIVIDLPHVDWRVDGADNAEGRGLIARYRFGLFQPGNSRVVLDLTGPVAIHKIFVLPPQGRMKYRFVIDMGPTGRQEFIETARAMRLAPKPGSAAAASPSVPKPRPRNISVIVIDPGHGGIDPGTIGRTGIYEKDIVLAVAKEIRRRLAATGRYHVVLTREKDVYIPLERRVEIARESHADLFISVHADSIKRRDVRGAAVYTLSEKASDQEAAELAARENKSDLIAGVDLGGHSDDVANILIDLAQRDTQNRSAAFAQSLVPELGAQLKLRRRPHRFAGFRVLKAPDIPSVLVEIGYLSNAQEEKLLRSKNGRARIADAISKAIDGYVKNARSELR